ncbi:hypothetical protein [Phenylobacterium sp.]|uniref:hypothetical protein n=1 Tax=Phenylobacterium sp. TaxID=1871053 RepID=UPI002C16E80B|nr:hypothetical protein [Phenylobacterium sp.]HVI34390.1 hypothetical protein [Phenylobacterium sp.]
MRFEIFAAAGAAVLMAAGAAQAQPAVSWARTPTPADVAAAYPERARAEGVGGVVLLTCTLNMSLTPRDCATLRETPSGYGFATAARKVAAGLAAAPGTGLHKGVEVEVPVTFAPELAAAGPLVIRNPAWASIPTPQDFQATFPQTQNGVNSVRVALICTAQPGGALADCAVDREEPAGQGYGQAALALAPKFRVAAWSTDGQPTYGQKVRVPIRYELTQVQAAR